MICIVSTGRSLESNPDKFCGLIWRSEIDGMNKIRGIVFAFLALISGSAWAENGFGLETFDYLAKEYVKSFLSLSVCEKMNEDRQSFNKTISSVCPQEIYISPYIYDQLFSLAESGDIRARFIASYVLSGGINTEIDCKRAVEIIMPIINQDSSLTYSVARYYDPKRRMVVLDTSTARLAYVIFSLLGEEDIKNADRVGYLDGCGLDDRSAKTAFSFYLKSAEMGELLAMKRVSEMYENGEGVSKDISRSKSWKGKYLEKSRSYRPVDNQPGVEELMNEIGGRKG